MTAAASTLPASVVTLPAGTQLASSAASTAASSLNQSDFLQLLTAQLEKQDPLNPQSPSDFAAELAQFSTASGVQSLNTAMTSNSGVQATGLVGRNVAVPGNTIVLGSGGTATGAFQLSGAASDVTVQIRNAQGKVVGTLDLGGLGAGNQNFSWGGQGATGQAQPAGNYTYTVNATAAKGVSSVTATTFAVAPVTAVVLGGQSGPQLELGGGLSPAALSSVQELF
ncbi:MAG: flagellar hook capping protein [Alphaproteobacteria bacterium]|nr:flagellar hook capping protein [Alphaproteobacteria bacterium]